MNLLTRCAPGLLAAAIAAAAGVAVAPVAVAQTPSSAAATAPMPPRDRGDHGLHDGPGRHGGPMRELERFRTSLKLNAVQTALWDKAQATLQPPAGAREQMRAQRDRLAAMLDDPNFDPRKMAADLDSADAERRARTMAMRDAWFAVYDSLNPVQRGQAREFLRSHMGRSRGMHMRGERMGREHHEHGEGGRPPMPPTPTAPR